MSYKALKRGEENIGNEEETDAAEDRPQFEADSDVSEFWQEEKESDSGEERVVAKGRPEKLKPMRRAAANPGTVSQRSQSFKILYLKLMSIASLVMWAFLTQMGRLQDYLLEGRED